MHHTMLYRSTLFLFVLLLSDASGVVQATPGKGRRHLSFKKLPLPPPTVGPEGIAFDPSGAGPYVSVADGRILKWDRRRFVDFTVASSSRSKKVCDGSADPQKEPVCGLPLGLEFNNRTGDLYFVDAYNGLYVVGPDGGKATLLAKVAEDVPFKFPNAVDIDQETGVVYFTDASARYQRKDYLEAVRTQDKTGRLLKYDPRTKQVTVLLKGLSLAVGVAINKDASFVLIAEFIAGQVQRYWLKGPKANTSEVFLKPPGTRPDNIRRNERGEFWIGANFGAQLGITVPYGIRVNEEGKVLKVVPFKPGNNTRAISEVHEHQGALYVGNLALPYLGVLTL